MSEDINSRVSNQIDKMSTEEKDHILQSFTHFGSSPNPGDDKFNDRFPSVNVGKDGHHFGSQTHVF